MKKGPNVRRRVAVLAATVLVLGWAAPVTGRTAETETDVRIPMSDGVDLIGDVHLPDGDGRFPVILNLTPYGPATYFSHYLGEGYAHVNVDIRGTGRSEGALCIFCDREQQDVYDAVEWVAAQPWSDGNVGMMGGSYQGITPLLGASKQPPHLKAIVPAVTYADAYRDIVWHNGIFNANFVAQWLGAQTALSMTGTSTSSDLPARTEQRFVQDTRLVPWDSGFYWERSPYTKYDRIKVPTLHLGGWFDGFSRGTIRNFQGIASKHNRLIMNPCTHKGCGAPFDPLNPHTADAAAPGPDDPVLAWFDRFLKGERNGIEAEPAVQYYDLGAREWKQADRWPPAGTKLARYYLSGEPSGSAQSLNDGSLVPEIPTSPRATTEDRIVHDPTVGIAETFSKWGTVAATPHIRADQRIDEMRALTYTTEDAEKPLVLAGPMEFRFWGLTTASDADWIVKVTDVAPDGSSTLLSSGYVRSSHRAWDTDKSRAREPWLPNTQPSPVAAGKPMQHRVDVWDIAHTVQPGHRLRVVVSSGDFPNHEPYPEPGIQALLHDPYYPSQLILTVQ